MDREERNMKGTQLSIPGWHFEQEMDQLVIPGWNFEKGMDQLVISNWNSENTAPVEPLPSTNNVKVKTMRYPGRH